jgi:cytosine/adenosine deaminase-related metal-dependent hydrolase
MGFPKVAEMLSAGVLVSLSIDTTATPCNADMFSQMRVTLSTEMARVKDAGLTPRRMLQMATVDGARDLGVAEKTGSITPGKRADLILVHERSQHVAVRRRSMFWCSRACRRMWIRSSPTVRILKRRAS